MELTKTISDEFKSIYQHVSDVMAMVVEQQEKFVSLLKRLDLSNVDEDGLFRFVNKPYILRQVRKDIYELIIPRFINFSAGWPVRVDGEYSVYQVSRFIDLITPLPEWLRKEIGVERPNFNVHVDGDIIHVDKGSAKDVLDRLDNDKNVSVLDGKRLRVSSKSQFEIMRKLIRLGILPYAPKKVPSSLLRPANAKFELRPKQARDFQTLLDYSSASVFAKGGAGKTFFGMWTIASLTGKKIILSPRTSILQQWEARIRAHLGENELRNVELRTYQSLARKPIKGEYSLAIFEEAQHLPANMGIRASQISASVRLGLSATPWREDGNEDIIPALCGIPVGTDWETGEPPSTTIWLCQGFDEKIALARTLTQKPIDGKTMLFVYRIEAGNRVSRALRIPFIHGGTRQQYKEIQKANTFVISKIGDAGISLDARRVIEIDWLGGRAEMGQRALRTQHASEKGELHILMTPTEYKTNQKRISALYALDYDVRVKGA